MSKKEISISKNLHKRPDRKIIRVERIKRQLKVHPEDKKEYDEAVQEQLSRKEKEILPEDPVQEEEFEDYNQEHEYEENIQDD